MDLFAFIHTPDPTKVKVVMREREENEHLLLETTVGRTVPLLPVASDHVESELEASVDRIFGEGDSGDQTKQGGSVGEDHGTPSGPSVVGKSRPTLQRLLAGAVLNTEVEVAAMPTLPFVTASVSTTPEREDGDHTKSLAGLNLRTIGASQRFVISSDSSHHSGPTITEAEVNSLARSSIPLMTMVTTVTVTVDPTLVVKEKTIKTSLFSANSSSAGRADPNTGVFSDLSSSDFLVGGIRTVIGADTDLQKVYVPQWSVTNGSRLMMVAST
ncbi:hypothetical protein Tco_0041541, partial [Tanacetum coccineum]